MSEIARDIEELARVAVDCGFKIHNELGPGLLESVYEAILAAKLAGRGLKVEQQNPLDFEYDGLFFSEGLRIDLLIEDRLILELKSIERLAPVHGKQLTYLRLSNRSLGLLMNFGAAAFREGVKRVVNNHADFASLRLCVSQNPAVDPDRQLPGNDLKQ
ncbi:MAG: GxxExxY protein [Allosphingosinicella sp.]